MTVVLAFLATATSLTDKGNAGMHHEHSPDFDDMHEMKYKTRNAPSKHGTVYIC